MRSFIASIRIIAYKELREMLRDGRFRILALGVFVLLVAAGVAGWSETREAQRSIAAARAADQATWLDLGPRNPHSAAHFGHYAFKPRPLLSSLDAGVDPYLGTAVRLEAHKQDPFSLRPAEDGTAVQRLGSFSAAFILQVLVPLLIIFLGFGMFAGERQRGTLLQLASLGLEPRTLALGKALGLTAALALVLVPALGLGLGLTILGASGVVASDLLRLALAALVYGVYFAIWLTLVLAISAWAPRMRTALVVLLGFWMLSTLLVPRGIADIAERAHPVPSPRAFYAVIAEDQALGLDGSGSREERSQALEASWLERYGVDSVERLPVNFAGIALQAGEEHSNLVFDKHYGDLWRRYANQEQWHLLGGSLSPMLAVRSLSMALAGTDVASHRHFAERAERHRRELVRFLNDDMTHHAGSEGFGYLADEELWQAAPVFSYQPPQLKEVLRRQALTFFGLLVWWAVAMFLAARAVRRLIVLPGGAS